MQMLNLGCGQRFHPDWVNVDFSSPGPEVYAHDLAEGVPFRDASFDVVYHSHLLEHFNKDDAGAFLRDCFRVLRPGGVLRVAVPDLESLARSYLHCLDEAGKGDESAQARHEWSIIELVDQGTRHGPGGYMKNWWRDPTPRASDFIIERLGAEAREGMKALAASPGQPYVPPRDPLAVGRFRLGGEVHQWMYDRLSLGRLLEACGFREVRTVAAHESAIPDFASYLLDEEEDGSVRKPDSLFLEAVRPKAAKGPRVRPLKVVHLCESNLGGAGNAASRLHQSLLGQGVDSHMYSLHLGADVNAHRVPCDGVLPASDDGRVWTSPLHGLFWKNLNQVYRRHPGRPEGLELFSSPRCRSVLRTLPHLRDADVINFHWIPGMVDFERDLEFLSGRTIVWTMHDMNPFTGGCHYAFECERYTRGCGACWQLGSDAADESSQFLEIKRQAYARLNITPVTPSRWLGVCVDKSAVLGGRGCRVIPYSLPTDVFKPLDRGAEREALGIPKGARVVLFGADSVTLPRKGFSLLQGALAALRGSGKAGDLVLAVFGGGEDLPDLGLPTLRFGRLSDPSQIARAYNLADVFVVPSTADNLPNTVLESLACGTPVAGFDVGGLPDMVDHKATGWLAPLGDVVGLAQGVRHILDNATQAQRRLCRATTLEHWAMPVQAGRYIELYQSLLG
ncbi:glycosyltransferase [Desulfocurvus sp. DL9XJH121]